MEPSEFRLGQELAALGLHNELERSLSAMNAVQAELDTLTATAVSPDRLIKVTIGAHGDVRELEFDPDVLRTQDPQGLAAAILATLSEASTMMAAKLATRYAELAERLS
ncbi:YbaB/EbfC family nucleoid-associated protein [Kribbella sp. NPDC004536]|uniref:YbaB/EbfC family nucleoid-associated protein n=1 Tax=Kribbella sp. NPDC004536 TaxID=3364106 RepID=UPI0036AEAA60